MISHIVWDIDPQVFHKVGYLRWYGICWMLGGLLGYEVVRRIYKSENIPTHELDTLTFYVMIGGIVGARLGHILFYDPIHYLNNPIEILPIKINPTFEFTGLAGLASHGGILGALVGLYLYNTKKKQDYLWLLDKLMIGGALLGGFIRIGNLLNSEIIGTPSELPWAIVFRRVDDIPRHPSQLYEAIFYFLVAIALHLIWQSGKFSEARGFIFGLGMTLIFVQRFLIEFIKEDQVAFEKNLVLNMGQVLSLPLAMIGFVVVILSLRASPKTR